MDDFKKVLQRRNVFVHENCGVMIARVADALVGFDLAADLLVNSVDRRTVLYLSGGMTPKELYNNLARDEKILPGGVGLVDERYGDKFHGNSNEKMLRESGLLRYFEIVDVPFYPILEGGLSREETAYKYDERLRGLQTAFPKHLGILGIGDDGHTAGIPISKVVNSKYNVESIYGFNNFVVEYDDGGRYGERVTMSFLGLSMLDVLLVLVFGEKKRQALELVFSEGSEEDVPGRFYKRKGIAEKTLIITDQDI